tara:strand:+ start:124 stop:558 length:435 start_codon:yes stop_codon:yes gene_type:complete
MIRPATLIDVESIFDIAREQCERYPELKMSPARVRKGIIEAISTARHFVWVSVNGRNEPRGVLIGLASDNLWAQRQNCNIVLWTSAIRGDGMKLLREFRNWIRSRRAIRVAGFAPDTNHIDLRVWKLAEMMGFKRHGGAYLLYN